MVRQSNLGEYLGRGRLPGSRNKVTVLAQELRLTAIQLALEEPHELTAEEAAKRSWLERMRDENPKVFATILAKSLPKHQVTEHEDLSDEQKEELKQFLALHGFRPANPAVKWPKVDKSDGMS